MKKQYTNEEKIEFYKKKIEALEKPRVTQDKLMEVLLRIELKLDMLKTISARLERE